MTAGLTNPCAGRNSPLSALTGALQMGRAEGPVGDQRCRGVQDPREHSAAPIRRFPGRGALLAGSELLPAFTQGGTGMRKVNKGLTAAMSAVAVMTLAVPATAATRTSASGPWSCGYGDICVYSKPGGEGKKCEWSVGDPDWRRGSVRCSFALPRSIFIATASHHFKGVRFYGAANYKQPLYLIKSGEGKSVNSDEGGFTVRSHRWVR
ncbi:hypothetical protein [Streptomyces decoyicus]